MLPPGNIEVDRSRQCGNPACGYWMIDICTKCGWVPTMADALAVAAAREIREQKDWDELVASVRSTIDDLDRMRRVAATIYLVWLDASLAKIFSRRASAEGFVAAQSERIHTEIEERQLHP